MGKSETAKELARLLHQGKDDAFLKIDCTEFSDGADLSALVGAPPKYVGREQKPLFDPDIIQQDKSVILFDEIEKGSARLDDLLMQILEEGEITLLNGGNVVSFRNSIIIMTSNVGSSDILKLASGERMGFQTSTPLSQEVQKKSIESATYKALKKNFRPEFINRIDHRITYNPLDDSELGEVLENYIFTLSESEQMQRRNIGLTLSSDVVNAIVSQSLHRKELGARPVLRKFEQTVWRDYARNITSGNIPDDSWTCARLSDQADTDKDIPVEFFYSKIPSRPVVPQIKELAPLEVDEQIESDLIEL